MAAMTMRIRIIVAVALLLIVSVQECLSKENKSLEHIIVPCQGLLKDDILNRIDSMTQLELQVCPENQYYFLTSDFSISSIEEVYIIGKNSTVYCSNNTALSFTNVTNLYVENVRFFNCGNDKQNGGLKIVNCTNVILTGITIEDSLKTGLVMRNVQGEVLIENSNFINNNRYLKFDRRLMRNIQFLSCSDNDFTMRGGGMQLILGNKQASSSISIKNCKFLKNFGLDGGGLFLVLQEGARDNNVTIMSCVFEENHCHYGGGGMQVGYIESDCEYENETTMQNTIYVGKSNFSHNVAMFGGGTAVFSTFGSLNFSHNELIFEACNWTYNSAILGLAMDVSLSPWETLTSLRHLPSLVFIDCKFVENRDENAVNSSSISNKERGTLVVTRFKLEFRNKTVFELNLGSAIEATAAIISFASDSDVHFVKNRGEQGGGLNLKASSEVNIRSNSRFLFANNTATYSGGAIFAETFDKHSLINQQNCFVKYVGGPTPNNVSFVFVNNEAAKDSSSLQFRKEAQPVRYRGHSVYATSVLPCLEKCFNSLNINIANEAITIGDSLKCIGTFTLDHQIEPNDTRHQISSAPHHFAFNPETGANENNDSLCFAYVDNELLTVRRNAFYNPTVSSYSFLSEPLHFIPGKSTRVPLRLVDDLCSESSFLVQVKVVSSKMNSLFIHPAHSVLTDNFITLFGNESDSGQIQLTAPGIRSITITINVTMDKCPPGYVHRPYKDSNAMACQCSSDDVTTMYLGIERCNYTEFQAYIKNGYWVGYKYIEADKHNEDTLATAICPIGYCTNFTNSRRGHKLPPSTSSSTSFYVCNENRTGFLCGSCRENHSAFYHSNAFICGNNELCHLGPLFYILSEIAPVTILFLIVIFFNISFTSGPLNGVIFFIQMIDSLKIKAENFIWFEEPLNTLNNIRQVLFRMFSLNFFAQEEMSFCLIENASAMDMLVFKYVTIGYSLVLIIGTILLLKICTFKLCRQSLNIKGSIIHGLSAFLVMSYSECTRVSLMILTGINVSVGPGSKNLITKAFYNGNYSYFGAGHLKYALPALFFMLTLVCIPPLLLLSYPLCYKIFAFFKIEESRIVQITCKIISLEKIKPLFDSMQGAFKDRYRFFAGLYFLYRLCSLLSFLALYSLTDHYVLTGVMLVLFLAIHAAFRPYKKVRYNILDACLFCNLFIINTITHYNYSLSFDNSRNIAKIQSVTISIQLVLLSLPMFYLIIYTVYSTIMKLKTTCPSLFTNSSELNPPEDHSDLILRTLDERESLTTENSERDTSCTDYTLLEESLDTDTYGQESINILG